MSNEPKLHHYERPTESRANERRRHARPAAEPSKHGPAKKSRHTSFWAGILIIAILVIAIFPIVKNHTDQSGSRDLASSKSSSQKAVSPRKSKKVKTKPAAKVKTATKKTAAPKQTKQTATSQTQTKQTKQTKQTAQQNAASYVVKSGDTLFSIAQAHGTTVDKLVQLNGLAGPDAIQAGQTLKIR